MIITIHSEHCPGCRNSDPRPQGVDPLGVRQIGVDMASGPDETVIVTDKDGQIVSTERK